MTENPFAKQILHSFYNINEHMKATEKLYHIYHMIKLTSRYLNIIILKELMITPYTLQSICLIQSDVIKP